MSPHTPQPFWAHANVVTYGILTAIVLSVLFAVVVTRSGGDVSISVVTFGIGVYIGSLVAMRDTFTGPKM